MAQPIKNFAIGIVNGTLAQSETTLVMQAGETSNFPNPNTEGSFQVTMYNSTDYTAPELDPNVEIINVTAVSGNNYTVARGQGGTSDVNHTLSGKVYKIIQGVNKSYLDDKLSVSSNLSDVANVSTARTNLGIEIGVNVQAYNAALTGTTGTFTTEDQNKLDGIETGADVTDATNVASAGALMASNNLSDVNNASTARTNLGVQIGADVQAYSSVLDATTASFTTEKDTNITKGLVRAKGISIESPGASEDITMFFTDDAITVTQMNAVLNGSSTPSVTWTIRHGSDRSATGNEVATSGTTTTSTTTGSEVTSFNDATIPAGSWVWLETTAQSGTVDLLNVTIEYTID